MHISLSEARSPELTRANNLRHVRWKCSILGSMKTNSSRYVFKENFPVRLALGVCCRIMAFEKFAQTTQVSSAFRYVSRISLRFLG